ncbi:MAG: hypothetical protein WCA84_15660 [Ignavibacteriaceae bacterium]
MKLFKLLIAVILFFNYINAQDSVKISEYVRDFESHHLDSVVVHLKDRNFKDLYTTYSDKWGYYELKIPVSNYHCLYAIKESDYGKPGFNFGHGIFRIIKI